MNNITSSFLSNPCCCVLVWMEPQTWRRDSGWEQGWECQTRIQYFQAQLESSLGKASSSSQLLPGWHWPWQQLPTPLSEILATWRTCHWCLLCWKKKYKIRFCSTSRKYSFASQEKKCSRLMLFVLLATSIWSDDMSRAARVSDLDPDPWTDWFLDTILDNLDGTGISEKEVIWANSEGDLELTNSWRAFNVSSSSSTLTFVTSWVSLQLFGKVE